MTKQEWEAQNLRTVSARMRTEEYIRLRNIAEAEETSIHRIVINLLTKFMDEYEKGE